MSESPHYYARASSLKPDGSRPKIRIAEVKGKFWEAKKIVFVLLIFIYAILPWIKIGGVPLIFIDVVHRQFFLFGQTFNAQDFYLVFFFISGIAFSLFYITALLGRVWCGWACPHSVFLEGVFRRIERYIEGNKQQQILLSQAPWSISKFTKILLKHSLFILVSWLIANLFLSYFVSMTDLLSMIRHNPRQNWSAFVFMLVVTGIIYGNFAWFREQLCLIVCPYGRIQSALTDDHTLIIGYDEARGEPRGKKSDVNRGACINCFRCVDVCPTGIDIRNGLQLECVGCANCIDACDEIMEKVGQPKGLIRYDSLVGLSGGKTQLIRPRIILYTFLMILGIVVSSWFILQRKPFEANVLRSIGLPYQLIEGKIRNQYYIHLINKTPATTSFTLTVVGDPQANIILPMKQVQLTSLTDQKIPLFIEMPKQSFNGAIQFKLIVIDDNTKKQLQTLIEFVGPHE